MMTDKVHSSLSRIGSTSKNAAMLPFTTRGRERAGFGKQRLNVGRSAERDVGLLLAHRILAFRFAVEIEVAVVDQRAPFCAAPSLVQRCDVDCRIDLSAFLEAPFEIAVGIAGVLRNRPPGIEVCEGESPTRFQKPPKLIDQFEHLA